MVRSSRVPEGHSAVPGSRWCCCRVRSAWWPWGRIPVLVAEQCQLFVANTRSEGRVMTSILQEEPHHSIMVACEKDCLLTRKYLPEKRCYLRGGIMGPGHGLGQGTSCLREVRGTGKTSPGEERGNLSGDVPTLLLCCSFHLSHKLIPHGNLFCISSLSCRHQAAGSG